MNAPIIINMGQSGDTTALEAMLSRLQQGNGSNYGHVTNITPKPAIDVLDEMLVSKLGTGHALAYVKGLRSYVSAFLLPHEDRNVHEITTEHVEQWFAGRKEAPATRCSNTGKLSALFSYARRKKYLRENPCEFLERIRIFRQTPRILTPRQVQRAYVWTLRNKPRCLGWIVASFGAGFRPHELIRGSGVDKAHRVGWNAIDLDLRIVKVEASGCKTRRRRVVNLDAATTEWLRLAKTAGAELPVGQQTLRRFMRRLSRVLGLSGWPQDCARHTAASIQLAEREDAGKVARNLGNSEGILMKHYASLLSPTQAKRYRFNPKARHWKLARAHETLRCCAA